jgi:hypothetical protein
MSDATALALICANLFPGFFCSQYVLKIANDAFVGIAMGVHQGVPVSRTLRGISLYQAYVGYLLGVVTIMSLMAVLNWCIADLVDDGLVQTAAYLASVTTATGAIGVALNGTSAVVYAQRLLREARPD